MREAYEKAHTSQIQLSMNRQRELQLRERRNELERRLHSLKDTIDRANHLVSQTTVVLNYLTSDLQSISEAIEDFALSAGPPCALASSADCSQENRMAPRTSPMTSIPDIL